MTFENGSTGPDLLAYLDRVSYRPGETITAYAGTEHESSAVRLDIAEPGWRDRDGRVDARLTRRVPAVTTSGTTDSKPVRAGSFFVVENAPAAAGEGDRPVSYGALVWPGHLVLGGRERLMTFTSRSHELTVELSGSDLTATLQIGDARSEVTIERAAPGRRWSALAVTVDPVAQTLELTTRRLATVASAPTTARFASTSIPAITATASTGTLTWAGPGDATQPSFNGKLETPLILASAGAALLDALEHPEARADVFGRWDFAQDVTSPVVQDLSLLRNPGLLVNAPTRVVTGSRWTGDELSFTGAPSHYGAVHFHSDDLDDAGLAPAGRLTVPLDTPSGLYALTCTTPDGREDHVPFVVTTEEHADVVFLASTFTYLAYANNSLSLDLDYEGKGISTRPIVPSERELTLRRNPQLGKSQYDRHPDGSGVSHSSLLRPILNFRYDFQSAIQEAPRNFSADFLLFSWLQRRHGSVAALTDHDLHREGRVPSGTKVLVTSSHPEYCSSEMLDAMQEFVDQGGSIMYLGGNGFYWVTTSPTDAPHRTEVRRGHAGIRTWESAPGEVHHADTGEFGGLWRYRGRYPNRLFGVGMTAQGFDEKAPGYVRAPEALGPLADSLLDGLADGEPFGDFGYAMGGAAGDELDRMDHELGTPDTAIRLLTSLPHSSAYMLAIEDVDMVVAGLDGAHDPRVRSDVCIIPQDAGGYVFSVGSIAWACSLAWREYDNDVARFTGRVLELLLDEERASA